MDDDSKSKNRLAFFGICLMLVMIGMGLYALWRQPW